MKIVKSNITYRTRKPAGIAHIVLKKLTGSSLLVMSTITPPMAGNHIAKQIDSCEMAPIGPEYFVGVISLTNRGTKTQYPPIAKPKRVLPM